MRRCDGPPAALTVLSRPGLILLGSINHSMLELLHSDFAKFQQQVKHADKHVCKKFGISVLMSTHAQSGN